MAAAIAPIAGPDAAADVGAHLYAEHSDTILRYCRGQLGSETEAEDALQTTFVYALRAIRRGVVPENEAAWLTTIARNVCHWQRRTQARRGWHAGEVDFDAIESGRSEPGAYEDLRGLDEALASIPEQQRRAIVLREWLGVGPTEIAGKLGLSPGATHALLTRARVSLAGALTVARQPAVALAWLVYELRSQIRHLLGAATTKAGVAAVTVVAATGAGGVLIQQTAGADPAPRGVTTQVDRATLVPVRETGGTAETQPRSVVVRAMRPRLTAAPRATKRSQAASSPAKPSVVTRTHPVPDGSGSAGSVPAADTPTKPARPETASPLPLPPLAKLLQPPALPVLPAPKLPTVDPPVELLPELPPLPPTDVTKVVPDVAGTVADVVSGTVETPSVPVLPPTLP